MSCRMRYQYNMLEVVEGWYHKKVLSLAHVGCLFLAGPCRNKVLDQMWAPGSIPSTFPPHYHDSPSVCQISIPGPIPQMLPLLLSRQLQNLPDVR